jgi:pimeloyl-ACP methyl ester carboxylesterase
MTDEGAIIFNVQPQQRGFYCVWSCESAASAITVEHRQASGAAWSVHTPRQPGRTFVPVPSSGAGYVLRLRRRAGDGTEQVSAEISSELRRTRFVDRIVPAPRIPFSPFAYFNSSERFARRHRRAPLTTLDGNPVDATDPCLPNGFFRFGESLVLLARALSHRLEAHPTHPPDIVRRTARRLLWAADEASEVAAVRHDFVPPVAGEIARQFRPQGFLLELADETRSRIVQFSPDARAVKGVLVYHEGHIGAGITSGWDTVSHLLERGWEVYCLDMPLCGLNAVDAVPGLANHNDLCTREARTPGHPIASLVNPLRWLVSHVLAQRQEQAPLLLVGRSGGGFLSYLYAALDERVAGAVSIAGGVPLSQRLEYNARDIGDYEQFAPGFFDLVRHEDLMVAAAQRGLLLIFNRHDPDCFALRTGHPLERYLVAEAARFGGEMRVFIDPDNRGHSLGSAGKAELDRFLSRHEASR